MGSKVTFIEDVKIIEEYQLWAWIIKHFYKVTISYFVHINLFHWEQNDTHIVENKKSRFSDAKLTDIFSQSGEWTQIYVNSTICLHFSWQYSHILHDFKKNA